MPSYTLECCVDSVESAIAAERGGATRLELCADLPLGGTTPGLSLFRAVRRNCGLPVHVLVRPRFGDFCYSRYERELIVADAALFADAGADAVVTGLLLPDGGLDTASMATVMTAASGSLVTLHRAFDVCRDPFEVLEQAVALGLSTILTSGQAATASEGSALIAELHRRAAGRIQILAGSGVNSRVIRALTKATGTRAYHLSAKRSYPSAMVYRKQGVPMGLPLMSEFELWRTDTEEVAAVRQVLEQL